MLTDHILQCHIPTVLNTARDADHTTLWAAVPVHYYSLQKEMFPISNLTISWCSLRKIQSSHFLSWNRLEVSGGLRCSSAKIRFSLGKSEHDGAQVVGLCAGNTIHKGETLLGLASIIPMHPISSHRALVHAVISTCQIR